jgi:hypothetical protein
LDMAPLLHVRAKACASLAPGIAAWKALSPVGRSLFTAQELRDVGIRLMQNSKSACTRNAWAGVLPLRAN